MADSDIAITAGAGTKIDTRTVGAGVDEHRQVIVIGDPTTAANVATVDATFGLDVDVTRLPALATGSNAIGSITNTSFAVTQATAANLSANINGLIPGVGATNLGKQEDAAHVDGDTGVLVLGVRNHSTGATTDGDYSAFSVSPIGDIHTLTRRTRITATSTFSVTGAYLVGDQMSSIFTFTNAALVSGGNGVISNVTISDSQNLMGAVDIVFFKQSVTLAADNSPFTLTNTDGVNIVGVVQIAGLWTLGSAKFGQALNIMLPYNCTGTSLFAAMIARTANASMLTTPASVTLGITVERS